jgi:hypothetical protein
VCHGVRSQLVPIAPFGLCSIQPIAQVFLNHRRFHAQPMGRYDHPVGSGLPHRLADLSVVEQSRNIAGWVVAEEFIQEVTMRSLLIVRSGSSEVLTFVLSCATEGCA